MTDAAGIDGSRTSPRETDGSTARATQPAGSAEDADRRTSRAILGSAIVAVTVLVLLMPATPLVAFVLTAAVALGAIAAVVQRAEDRRSTGETLEKLATRGYLVLADRRSPALTGTIDHLVVGPGGVFVIETRDHPGRARIRGDQLVIRGYSYDVASHLRAQVAAVSTTLAPILDGSGTTVVPLVCMRAAELPLLHRDVAGIPLLRESQLTRRITHTRPVLDAETVARLGARIEQAMPQVVRHRAAGDATVEPGGQALPNEGSGYATEAMALPASVAYRSNGR